MIIQIINNCVKYFYCKSMLPTYKKKIDFTRYVVKFNIIITPCQFSKIEYTYKTIH